MRVSVIIVLVSCCLYSFPAWALTFNKEVKKCMSTIEMVEGVPDRPYTVITPIRAKKGKSIVGMFTGKDALQRVFSSLKEQACEQGADAIVDVNCSDAVVGGGSVHGDSNGIHGDSSVDTVPVCYGKAIRWK